MTELETLKRELDFIVKDRNQRVAWYRQKIEDANRLFDERATILRREIAKLDPQSATLFPMKSTEPRSRPKKAATRTYTVLKSDGTEVEINV